MLFAARPLYADLVERKILTVNRATDLKHFIGRSEPEEEGSEYFAQDEASKLAPVPAQAAVIAAIGLTKSTSRWVAMMFSLVDYRYGTAP